MARFLSRIDRYHWVFLLLAAPLLVFISPNRVLILLIVPVLWLVSWKVTGKALLPTPLNLSLLVLTLALLVSIFATYDLSVSLPKIGGLILGLAAFFALCED